MNFTKIARQEAASFWKGSFEHPFITALADGNLAPEIFRYYLLQDRYYLEHFSKLYHLIAEQTNDREAHQILLLQGCFHVPGCIKKSVFV